MVFILVMELWTETGDKVFKTDPFFCRVGVNIEAALREPNPKRH